MPQWNFRFFFCRRVHYRLWLNCPYIPCLCLSLQHPSAPRLILLNTRPFCTTSRSTWPVKLITWSVCTTPRCTSPATSDRERRHHPVPWFLQSDYGSWRTNPRSCSDLLHRRNQCHYRQHRHGCARDRRVRRLEVHLFRLIHVGSNFKMLTQISS